MKHHTTHTYGSGPWKRMPRRRYGYRRNYTRKANSTVWLSLAMIAMIVGCFALGAM